jgi:photosystem II stability/assembly factor-like uncharacterized protein
MRSIKAKIFASITSVLIMVVFVHLVYAGWNEVFDSGAALYALDVRPASSTTSSIAVGSGRILKTQDAGTSWVTVATSGATFYDVKYLSGSAIVAVGESGGVPHLTRSDAAGNSGSWNEITMGIEGATGALHGIDFRDLTTGVTVGVGGQIFRTTTGGGANQWTAMSSPVTTDLNTVFFSSTGFSDRVWVVGTGGVILKSTNAGLDWTTQTSGVTAALHDIHFATADRGVAVGANGTILRTLDAGETWTSCAAPTTDTLYGVWMQSFDTVWVVGSGGTVHLSTDVSTNCTWARQTSGSSEHLYDIQFQNTNTGWYVGAGGEIHRFDNKAPTGIKNLRIISQEGNLTPSFIWDAATDNILVTEYIVSLNGGAEISIGTDPNYTTQPVTDGSHTLQIYAIDAAGNQGAAASIVFSVGDLTKPDPPPNLTRTSVITDPTPTFTWSPATDNQGVTAYEVLLERDGVSVLDWVSVGNVLTYTLQDDLALTIEPQGTLVFSLRSVDAAGNKSSVVSTQFATPVASNTVFFPAGVHAGNLVKIADDENPNTFGDTAVYYVGADGKRYVFPNNQVYHSWYTSFDAVRIISTETMAQLSLGGVVTYRPGVKMVKVQSSPVVYVVARGGVLRPIASEAVARDLYGEQWNQRIDDIGDGFWGTYTTGGPVSTGTDFDPTKETATVIDINTDKLL